MQRAVGCEYIHTMVNGCQLTVYHAAGVCWELYDQFIGAHNGKPPWLTNAFVCTVHEIEDHNVVSYGIVADEFRDKHPREWTNEALITFEVATDSYVVEVIAASHCLKQQLISCWYLICLLRWQGKEVLYSWNSQTCAWPWIWPKWPKKCFCAPQ